MKEGHLERLLQEAGTPQLLEALAEDLSPTDLQSLLLQVYELRAGKVLPGRLLQQYLEDRFVCASPTDPRTMLEVDQTWFSVACPPFEPVELSPVCPLGTVSVLGDVSQNWVVPTARNKDVVSDSTNCMALECAVRRRAGKATVRLCTSHRVLRPQSFSGPGSFAHFRLFGLCSAGRDAGDMTWQTATLLEHVRMHVRLLYALRAKGYAIGQVHLLLTDLATIHGPRLTGRVVEPMGKEFPDLRISLDPERSRGRGYYDDLCFEVRAADAGGEEHSLSDGGLTDWTAKLLSNKKECLMISGMGTERLASLFASGAVSGEL